jgi:hypothetical protein
MFKSNVINNVNIEELPESVREVIIMKMKELPVLEKLIVYSRLTHGNLFKADRVDLFKLNRISIAQVYEKFVNSLRIHFEEIS